MVAAGRIVAEELAMDAADGFPVFDVGEKHAGADNVVEGCAGFSESFFGDGEDAAGLSGCVFVVGADGAGAGEMNGVARRARRGRSR